MRKRLDDGGRIGALGARVTALEARVAAVEARLKSVEARVTAVERELAGPRSPRAGRVSRLPRCPGCLLELPRKYLGPRCVWCGFALDAVPPLLARGRSARTAPRRRGAAAARAVTVKPAR